MIKFEDLKIIKSGASRLSIFIAKLVSVWLILTQKYVFLITIKDRNKDDDDDYDINLRWHIPENRHVSDYSYLVEPLFNKLSQPRYMTKYVSKNTERDEKDPRKVVLHPDFPGVILN